MNLLNQKVLVALIATGVFLTSNLAFGQEKNVKEAKSSTPINNSLSSVTQLNPLLFENKPVDVKQLNKTMLEYGFKAEDVQKILPGLVKTEYKLVPAGKGNYKRVAVQRVDMNSLIPLLVASIKEQQVEIEKLKSDLQLLKSSSQAQ